MSRTRTFAARAAGLAATALIVAACASSQEPERAAVEYKGTDPSAPETSTAPATPSTPSAPSGQAGAGGIVSYEGYQAAVAREGDTVASVANRIGLSPSELGAYNGLPPDHQLREGDELVLPQRPDGYGAGTEQARTGTSTGTGTQVAQAQTGVTPGVSQHSAIESAPLEAAPIGETGTGASGQWSPAVAAAAIERAEGFDDEGNPGAPPSANEPLPPDPEPPAELASPQLGQYQTREPTPRPDAAETAAGPTVQPPAPRPTETITTRAEQPAEEPAEPPAQEPAEQTAEPPAEQTEVARATPAAPAELSLIRPARGPIVVGFQEGPGRARNDGVDFASPVGSPVVAAADGEVALVSQSLGGLGTIVLLRHHGDYLTVYGRIDRVAVSKGDIVSQGQQIGVVASNAEPRMHFEVRRGAESLDPERFLTGRS